jgi:methylglutaconyl-CoA hydratase
VIRVETADRVRTVTLDRADKRNALTPTMLGELAAAFAIADNSGAVLVRGEGRVFCAGFDLDLCKDDPDDQPTMRALLQELSRALRAMRACPVPVVLAAHGAAIAGGCALLGGADLVVSDRDAKLGYPVVRLGVSPAVSAPLLRLGVGDGAARRLLLDPGLTIGERAHTLGLVHELVESREQVGPCAHELAKSLASRPEGGMIATKRWLNEIDGGTDDALDAGLAASLSLIGGEEANRMLQEVWNA